MMTNTAASAQSEDTVTPRSPATPVVAVLLAACAGVVDLWAITSLGGAYAGVATGNLVNIGRAAGQGQFAAMAPPGVAVAGFAFGAGCWPLLWRHRPRAITVPLLAELVALGALCAGWIAIGTRPGPSATLVLLGGAAITMGAQSAIALRLGEATTYLTGALTGIVVGLVKGDGLHRLAAARQLVALVAGASVAAWLLLHQRAAIPVTAAALLTAAVVIHGVATLRDRHRLHRERTS